MSNKSNKQQKKLQDKMNKISAQQSKLDQAEDVNNVDAKSEKNNKDAVNIEMQNDYIKMLREQKNNNSSDDQQNINTPITNNNGIDMKFSYGSQGEVIVDNTPIDSNSQPASNDEADKNTNKSKKKSSFLSSGKKSQKMTIPKTVQDSIPYINVYKNGIIETSPGVFTKSYKLDDVNFKIATQEEQENIFIEYGNLLNMFGPEIKAEITIFNRNIDQEEFKRNTLLKLKNDGLDRFRVESNNILLAKMNEGKNNIIHEKYLTLAIESDDVDLAIKTFARIDTDVTTFIKKINNAETKPMTLCERLSMLHEIYNLDAVVPFNTKAKINGHNATNFDISWLRQQGLTTKDLIAPDSLSFKQRDYFMVGDKYARSMFIDNLPTFLSTDFLVELTDISCNLLTSLHFESIPQEKTVKLIRNQIVNINSNVIDAQKKAAKSGYSADLISPELLKAQNEADKLMEDVSSRNQKMFLTTLVLTVFGDSLEDLEKNTKALQTTAAKFLCNLRKLNYQQEYGFTASLPLAYNKLHVDRLLTTEAASVFMPFSSQELSQQNGMYYGLNAVSRNLILFNRLNSKNANGVILGTPGSGKSFSAKREMINVLLNTDDDIYIIDPEREYAPLAALFGGEVIRIAAGSNTHINPLDMDLDYADDDDPITLKSDFIGSICETVIGGRYGLSPVQKTVIDRCVRLVYQGYMEHLSKLGRAVTCDKDAMPTLNDFYKLLLAQPESEARNIALALELYCKGSLDTFAYRTNVNTKSRFIIYDIKDIGSGMKEMGLQVCLNDIWNKIIENKKRNKKTWFYIDEFYLLTQNDSSAKFLQQIYKRARKWGGIPTGITQNVEDLLASKEARGIINNCDFILMLNQSPLDRAELGAMLNISPLQMSYITNSDAGQGLLYTGKFIIPFIDKFPSGNCLYDAMTTKPDEVNLDEFEAKTNDK